MDLFYISDEDLLRLVPSHRTRTAVQNAVNAFRTSFSTQCDVLVMGPEDGGWYECKNTNGTPIDTRQASRLVHDRIVQLM